MQVYILKYGVNARVLVCTSESIFTFNCVSVLCIRVWIYRVRDNTRSSLNILLDVERDIGCSRSSNLHCNGINCRHGVRISRNITNCPDFGVVLPYRRVTTTKSKRTPYRFHGSCFINTSQQHSKGACKTSWVVIFYFTLKGKCIRTYISQIL